MTDFVHIEGSPETLLRCVHCNVMYHESENAQGSCQVHRKPGNPKFCCGLNAPCLSTKHRSQHHNEFPYSALLQRISDVVNYTDTVDTWGSVSDQSEEAEATVYLLHRWQTRAAALPRPLLLLKVGNPWRWTEDEQTPFLFATYSCQQLKELEEKEGQADAEVEICNSAGAVAAWVFDGAGKLKGVKISSFDNCKMVNFTASAPGDDPTAWALQQGEVEVVSEVQREYCPSGGAEVYTSVPQQHPPIQLGAPVAGAQARPAREFETAGDLCVRCVQTSPLTCSGYRRDKSGAGQDEFSGAISVVNLQASTTCVVKVWAQWRFVGDSEWLDVPASCFRPHLDAPFSVPPNHSASLAFRATLATQSGSVKVEATQHINSIEPITSPLSLLKHTRE